jgi:hypothetical protein
MNAPPKLSLNDQIRARDGDKCWLCGGKLDFKAEPNSSKAPTREHLLAQSLGGTSDLANLVLCHPGCNKQLGNRRVAEKEKMRANRLAGRQLQMAGKKAKVATAAPPKTSAPTVPKIAGPKSGTTAVSEATAPKLVSPTLQTAHRVDGSTLRQWQVAALIGGGLALLFFGFSIGLLVG